MNATTESWLVTENHTSPGVQSPVSSDLTEESTVLDLYTTIVNVYIDGLLCVLGYFGNLITILLLQRQGVRNSNAVLLQALAVFDSCFLTYVVLYVVLRTAGIFTNINEYIVAFVLPFGWTSQTATIWTVMAIVIDRFLIVFRPLKVRQWCTVKHARIAVGCIAVAAVLFNAVRWPRYYFVAFANSVQNNETFVSHLSASIDNWNEDTYKKVYHISITFVFLFLIPLSVIIALNIGLMYFLLKSMKLRRKMTSVKGNKSQEDKNTTKSSYNISIMVAVMITIFVACELPDFIAAIIGAAQFKKDPTTYKFYAVFKEFMLVLNSAINFYIYIIFNKTFRLGFKKVFGCTQTEKDNDNSNTSVVSNSTMIRQLSASSLGFENSGGVTGISFTLIKDIRL